MGGIAWTQEEIDYVRDHMDIDTAKEIAAELDRSVSSVYYKIRELSEREESMTHLFKSNFSVVSSFTFCEVLEATHSIIDTPAIHSKKNAQCSFF